MTWRIWHCRNAQLDAVTVYVCVHTHGHIVDLELGTRRYTSHQLPSETIRRSGGRPSVIPFGNAKKT